MLTVGLKTPLIAFVGDGSTRKTKQERLKMKVRISPAARASMDIRRVLRGHGHNPKGRVSTPHNDYITSITVNLQGLTEHETYAVESVIDWKSPHYTVEIT